MFDRGKDYSFQTGAYYWKGNYKGSPGGFRSDQVLLPEQEPRYGLFQRRQNISEQIKEF